MGLSEITRHETGWASVDGVYRDLDRAVARRLRSRSCKVSAAYAYEDGALDTFSAAKETGRACLYDLPIAHWATLRRLLEEEAERLPEWAPTLDGLKDSAAKHERKDAELAMADHVIVASSFTRKSLEGVSLDADVHVIPYGCPKPVVDRPAQRSLDAPLEMFFAGHLNQRKGLADLIAAVGLLSIDWRLTLAGPKPPVLPDELSKILHDPRCIWLGTVPHRTLLEHMTRAHVFVFPSIVEGFGMVITEALACGLPVITTPNTAGPDVLTEGVDGFIVPIRDPEAIAEKVTWLAENEDERQIMGRAALDKARSMCWSRYESRIADLIAGTMKW